MCKVSESKKRYSRFWLIIVLGLFCSAGAIASIEVYQFDSPEYEARFKRLIQELRCPKCQNQNVADSDAMIAKDIKDRVYEWVQEGRTEAEITGFLVARYGDFVTYKPPLKGSTLILWFGPPLAFLVILIVIVMRVRRSAMTPLVDQGEAQEDSVKRLLEDLKGKS